MVQPISLLKFGGIINFRTNEIKTSINFNFKIAVQPISRVEFSDNNNEFCPNFMGCEGNIFDQVLLISSKIR